MFGSPDRTECDRVCPDGTICLSEETARSLLRAMTYMDLLLEAQGVDPALRHLSAMLAELRAVENALA